MAVTLRTGQPGNVFFSCSHESRCGLSVSFWLVSMISARRKADELCLWIASVHEKPSRYFGYCLSSFSSCSSTLSISIVTSPRWMWFFLNKKPHAFRLFEHHGLILLTNASRIKKYSISQQKSNLVENVLCTVTFLDSLFGNFRPSWQHWVEESSASA